MIQNAVETPAFPIYTLLRHCDVSMGLSCLATLRRFARDAFQHVILDDGTLTEADRDGLHGLGPIRIVPRNEADDLVMPLLRTKPNCARFRSDHPFALKLIDPPLLNSGRFALCDCDIVFLRPFAGLDREVVRAGHEDIVFMRDRKTAYSVSFASRHWGLSRVRMPEFVNAGLLYVGPRTFDLDFVEWFLGRPEYRRSIWVLEQTAWAALGGRVRAHFFDPEQVAFPGVGPLLDSARVALHFISPFRDRLEEVRPRPEPERHHFANGHAPTTLRTLPALFYGPARDAAVRLARRIRSRG
jgi:hypothetical protein